MATGTGNLPNQNMDFTPFDILTAEEMDDLVENIESLADGSGIGDRAVTPDKVTGGVVAQVVSAGRNDTGTTTASIPVDDTIPQSNEGLEFITVSITPTRADSVLEVEGSVFFSTGTGVSGTAAALFISGQSNAFAASTLTNTANFPGGVAPIYGKIVAGTTSTVTITMRIGSTGGTLRFNGISGSRVFGDIAKSFLRVTEVTQ